MSLLIKMSVLLLKNTVAKANVILLLIISACFYAHSATAESRGDLLLFIDQSLSMTNYDHRLLIDKIIFPVIKKTAVNNIVLIGFSENIVEYNRLDSTETGLSELLNQQLKDIKIDGDVTDFSPPIKYLQNYNRPISLVLFISDAHVDVWDRGRKYLSQRILADNDYLELNNRYRELKEQSKTAFEIHDQLNYQYQKKNIAITKQNIQLLSDELDGRIVLLNTADIPMTKNNELSYIMDSQLKNKSFYDSVDDLSEYLVLAAQTNIANTNSHNDQLQLPMIKNTSTILSEKEPHQELELNLAVVSPIEQEINTSTAKINIIDNKLAGNTDTIINTELGSNTDTKINTGLEIYTDTNLITKNSVNDEQIEAIHINKIEPDNEITALNRENISPIKTTNMTQQQFQVELGSDNDEDSIKEINETKQHKNMTNEITDDIEITSTPIEGVNELQGSAVVVEPVEEKVKEKVKEKVEEQVDKKFEITVEEKIQSMNKTMTQSAIQPMSTNNEKSVNESGHTFEGGFLYAIIFILSLLSVYLYLKAKNNIQYIKEKPKLSKEQAMLQAVNNELDSLSTNRLEEIQAYFNDKIEIHTDLVKRVKRKLLALGKSKYQFNKKIDLCIDLQPCMMVAIWKNDHITNRATVINASMNGILILKESGRPEKIDSILCNNPIEEFNISKSRVVNITESLYEVIIDEFEQKSKDKMRWVEVLSRIDTK